MTDLREITIGFGGASGTRLDLSYNFFEGVVFGNQTTAEMLNRQCGCFPVKSNVVFSAGTTVKSYVNLDTSKFANLSEMINVKTGSGEMGSEWTCRSNLLVAARVMRPHARA